MYAHEFVLIVAFAFRNFPKHSIIKVVLIITYIHTYFCILFQHLFVVVINIVRVDVLMYVCMYIYSERHYNELYFLQEWMVNQNLDQCEIKTPSK